ncbi:hypothetical protein K3G39_13875 [Pontibacter sp. HSC-14F20]|uniref:hypothetical protein n=1 Tax=Pontibacter sp. HSC-14F20 TaxID=2864136 RepID=UPI001C72CB53|nr:hypothetical protein [Pontibacter sp. HSC-14F20]MBX0334327.1 hypothetical protein [Pontibacter sp. HSC-14F20]
MEEFDIELTLADVEFEPLEVSETGFSGLTLFLGFVALLVLGLLLYNTLKQEPLRKKTPLIQ